jgi:hypothetical protein
MLHGFLPALFAELEIFGKVNGQRTWADGWVTRPLCPRGFDI